MDCDIQLTKRGRMDKETSEMLKETTALLRASIERTDAVCRGLQALSKHIGPLATKATNDAMGGEDHTALMKDAAAECLSPDQYEHFESVGHRDPEALNRLYRCIMKRVK
jgi:hypothetical protein